jgi:hypothetical protein
MKIRKMTKVLSILIATIVAETRALLFRPDQFKDMTETCRKSNGKQIRFILNEDNPAMYVSVDPTLPTPFMTLQRAERAKLFSKFTLDDKLLFQVRLVSDLSVRNSSLLIHFKIATARLFFSE